MPRPRRPPEDSVLRTLAPRIRGAYNQSMHQLPLRIGYGFALLTTIVVGTASRLGPLGWAVWDKSLGDVLYAVAAYLLLRMLRPAMDVRYAALLIGGYCWAIEAFKLTGLPAAWSVWRPARLVLGVAPSWHNVLCYSIGTLLIAAVDGFIRRRRRVADVPLRPRP